MTLAILAVAWAALAVLVSSRGGRAAGTFRPGVQAGIFFSATLGLATIPASALIVLLSQTLFASEASGSLIARCTRLIVSILKEPVEQPGASFALLLLVAGAGSFAVAAVRSWRSQSRSSRLIRNHEGSVVTIPCDELFAFTAGFFRPRVVASSSLLTSVPADWRKVVLAHEEAHRKGRHPLLVLIAESLAGGLPLRPVRRGADAFRLALEMAADESASRAVGSRELVAEAVSGIALNPVGAGVGFEGDVVCRVRRLLAPERARWGLLLVLAVVGVLGFAGGHAMHCGDAALQSLRAEGCRVHLAVHASSSN